MSENSGRWKPGQSGNPAGRKPGSGSVAALRASLAECLPDVLSNLTKAAVAGDMQATRILLDRVLPPLRAEEGPVSIDIPAMSSLTAKAEAVLTAAASGEVGTSQATQMISALGTTARIMEAEELEKRIAALETAIGKKR
jgi:hypothetical protein